MSKEYKTLLFKDTSNGRKKMEEDISKFAQDGWEIKSKETTQQGWNFGKTCCLGVIFLPLALLGRKGNSIQIIMEREINKQTNN
ncbi:DUF4177 domain-containing protein [Candidatus Parcubacteria bacterium]|nr:DUF4177 domain-containing protein [Candidatus Parcubacteria bacterium]